MTATYRPTPQVPALDGMTPLGVTPQKTLEERVLEWTEQLCESLAENYKQYHLRSMKQMNAQRDSEYSRKEIEATENGTANLMKFRIQKGKKYYKIIQQDYDTFRDRNESRDGGVPA